MPDAPTAAMTDSRLARGKDLGEIERDDVRDLVRASAEKGRALILVQRICDLGLNYF